MRTKITLMILLFFSLNIIQAKNIYFKISTDTEAWKHIPEDEENVIQEISPDNTSNINNMISEGDICWFAKGVYPSPGVIRQNGCRIYGGFRGDESDLDERRKVDLDGNGLIEPWEFKYETQFIGDTSGNANYRMFQLQNGMILDGIIISDHTRSTSDSGGAVYVKSTGNEIVRNCVIRNITIYSSSPSGAIHGAGINAETGKIDGCLVENCTFYNDENSTGELRGAGLAAGGSTVVSNSVFRNNKADSSADKALGGGLWLKDNVVLENCLVYNNYSNFRGGGIFINGSSKVKIYNVTVANNQAKLLGSGIFQSGDPTKVEVYNTVCWDNKRENGTMDNIYFRFTMAWGRVIYNGGLNKDSSVQTIPDQLVELNPITNPAFINPTTFVGIAGNDEAKKSEILQANWSLQPSSELINKMIAVDGIIFPETDLLGKSRQFGNAGDIGAYENHKLSANVVSLPGDKSQIELYGEWNTEAITQLNNLLGNDKKQIGLLDLYETKITAENLNLLLDGCINITSLYLKELPTGYTTNSSSPNCLVYLPESASFSEDICNVVYGCEVPSLKLTHSFPFHTDRTLDIEDVTYTRIFEKQTGIGEDVKGWETIALPFNVEEVTIQRGDNTIQLEPFGEGQFDYESGKIPFWLRKLVDTSDGFMAENSIEANTPYIISMPNNPTYADKWNVNGEVVFTASDIVIKPFTSFRTLSGSEYDMTYTFKEIEQEAYIYPIDEIGARFVADSRSVLPFEAYVINKSAGAPKSFAIGGGDGGATYIPQLAKEIGLIITTEGGEIVIHSTENKVITVYNIAGIAVKRVEIINGENRLSGLSSGIYIVESNKVIL